MIGYEKGILKLRGQLDKRTHLLLQIGGFVLLLLIWTLLTIGKNPIVGASILPSPKSVFSIFRVLIEQDNLLRNVCLSVGLNLAGYLEAIILALIIGFLIGLYPLFDGLFQRQVDAIRFIPLTAVQGVFMVAFGLGIGMKVHFLAFGIFIYLLPVVVQRVREVEEVYLKTVYTLGASNWQIIKTVYIPYVLSKVSADIRVLTAISWTYIIIAEMLGSQGGIGALIWRVGTRQGRMDKTYAILLIFILIGVLQDRLFKHLDRTFFPFKYVQEDARNSGLPSIFQAIAKYIWNSFIWTFLLFYQILILNEFTAVLTETKVLEYLFGGTAWVVNLIVLFAWSYKIRHLYSQYKKANYE